MPRFVLVLLVLAAHPLRGTELHGSPDDFAPVVNGTIHDLFAFPNGDVVIVGEFTEANGAPRSRIARLDADGTLSPDFAAGADGAITHLAPNHPETPDAFFIAGDFSHFDGEPANRLCKLDAAGQRDPTFDPGSGPDGAVTCLDYHPDFSILAIGGAFQNYAGTTATHLAITDENGALIPGFGDVALPDAPVRTLDMEEQYLVIGGEFKNVGATAQPYYGKYLLTQPDTQVLVDLDSTTLAFDGPVNVLRISPLFWLGPLGVIATGEFTRVSGLPRNGAAVVSLPTDAVSPQIASFTGGAVRAIELDRFIELLPAFFAVGDFSHAQGLGFRSAANLILPADPIIIGGSRPYEGQLMDLDLTFAPGSGADGPILAAARTPLGGLYVAGAFSTFDGKPRDNIARLHGPLGGSPPRAPGFLAASPANHDSVALTWEPVESEGIHRGGQSYVIDRIDEYVIEQLEADGSTWTPVATRARVGGAFLIRPSIHLSGLAPDTKYRFRVRARHAVGAGPPSPEASVTTLSAPWTGAGTIDRDFSTRFPGVTFTAVLPLSDGRLLVSGSFDTLQDEPRNRLAMLLPDGSLDPFFKLGDGLSGVAWSLVELPDGKLLLGGEFTSYNGNESPSICRLHADGRFDASFQSPWDANSGYTRELFVFSNKRIAAGRTVFTQRQSRPRLEFLHPDGRLDDMPAPPSGLLSGFVDLRDGSALAGWFKDGAFGYAYRRVRATGVVESEIAFPFPVRTVATDALGRLYLGGNFTLEENGEVRRGLARLLPDFTPDPTFHPPDTHGAPVTHLAILRDGKLVVGGDFLRLDSRVVPGLARLNSDGSLDEMFFSPGLYETLNSRYSVTTDNLLSIDRANRVYLAGLRDLSPHVGDSLFVRLPADPVSPLEAPASLTATPQENTSVLLSWQPAARSYATRLERSEDGLSWTTVAELDYPIDSWLDRDLSADTRYFYRVVATADLAESPPSPAISVTTFNAFQVWLAEAGLPPGSDPLSDPFSTGSSLLINYALGAPANVPPGPQFAIYPLFGRCYFFYPRPRSDLRYQVQQSIDGMNWTAFGVEQGPPGPQGAASVPIEPSATLLRLAVQPR